MGGQLFGGMVAFQHHINPLPQAIAYAISRLSPVNNIVAVYISRRGQRGR